MKILALLFLTSFCIAQNKNLTVTYGLVFQNDELINKDGGMFKVHYDYAVANPNRFMFDLKIDSFGSSFEIKNKLSTDEKTLSDKLAFVFAKYPGLILSFRDSILKQSTLLGNKVFIKSEVIKGWTLTNESKEIDGYLCYKAVNIDRVVNGSSVFEHPIIAWYCPKLPFSYGPIGYGNLPGLILQLQVRNVVYGVSKIDFDADNLPDYSILKKGEIISEDEESFRLKSLFDD
ncbi:GLPGLI family protein [Flavobacterium sp.]|jgi:GLPGLI family protein|uniref:GLPGLI family protein n=1 Tax=Flavobacterium sp. TaxID=239 RepID=UPI0037C144CB